MDMVASFTARGPAASAVGRARVAVSITEKSSARTWHCQGGNLSQAKYSATYLSTCQLPSSVNGSYPYQKPLSMCLQLCLQCPTGNRLSRPGSPWCPKTERAMDVLIMAEAESTWSCALVRVSAGLWSCDALQPSRLCQVRLVPLSGPVCSAQQADHRLCPTPHQRHHLHLDAVRVRCILCAGLS